jgi:hypothetical protein
LCKSRSLPGVAIRMSTGFDRSLFWSWYDIPPVIVTENIFKYREYVLILSDIWLANSRVGEIINTLGPFPLRFALVRWLKMGNTNAAVFPVPVCAVARTCSFWRIWGIDFFCIAVGSL